MARIILSPTPRINARLLSGVQQAIDLRDSLERTKDLIDEITNGGVNKAALETADPQDVICGVGNGAAFYDAVNTIFQAINAVGVRSVCKQFDRG
jgi:hypothetical protein